MYVQTCEDIPGTISVSRDVDAAHRLIRQHLDCGRHCPARRAAVDVLEEAGHYRLATRFG
jgi:hypothetical protein